MKILLIILVVLIIVVLIDTLIGYLDKRTTQIKTSGKKDSNRIGVAGYGKKASELSEQINDGDMLTFACEGKYNHEVYRNVLIKTIVNNDVEIAYAESVGAIVLLDAISTLNYNPVKKIVINAAPTSFDDVKMGKIMEALFCNRPCGPLSRLLLGLGANGDVIAGKEQLKDSFLAISSSDYKNLDHKIEIVFIYGEDDPVTKTEQAYENWRNKISIKIQKMSWTGHCPTGDNSQEILSLLNNLHPK